MTLNRFLLYAFFVLAVGRIHSFGQQTSFHVLAFYSEHAEYDHVEFARQAIQFYRALAEKDHFEFATTTNWDDLNNPNLLKQYQVILWLNDFPSSAVQRASFEQYMNQGGGWLGFHVAAYNDAGTHWPWFVDFLGGAIFYGNNWPPLPAKLVVDDKTSAVTRRLPASFIAPANEWYIWKPDPRLNKGVKVLLALDPSNYPLGLKDTLTGGDLPVVWSNTKYKMVYMNMGHGNRIFASPTQNLLFEDAVLLLGRGK